jgi:hypothetical protein
MIPFTQYLRPDGRKVDEGIDMPAEIEALAQRFLRAGGRYEAEVLREGTVSFTAVYRVNEEPQDIAIELCPNGPDVPYAVEMLVRKSIAWLDRRI